MKKLSLVLVPMSILISAQAFAWKGDGNRSPTQSKIPADIGDSGKTVDSDNNVEVLAPFSNRNGTDNLVCDVFASVIAHRGANDVTVTSFNDKVEVDAYTDWKETIRFRVAQFGQGFILDKNSQHYEFACLTLDQGEGPAQVPPPHTKCDPEYSQCDWTCKATQQSPDQCANPNQNW